MDPKCKDLKVSDFSVSVLFPLSFVFSDVCFLPLSLLHLREWSQLCFYNIF